MPVTIDLSALKTPPNSGDALIEPAFRTFDSMVESNMTRSGDNSFTICGLSFSDYRQMVRSEHDLPADQPVIAMGHQPEFYHCGVWAKSTVCQRLAGKLGATSVNVMIDHDKVKSGHLQVPYADSGRVRVTHIPIQEKQPAVVYEQMPIWRGEDLDSFSRQLDEVPGTVDRTSLMPILLQGFAQVRAPRDWVSQYVFATQAVDRTLGISLRYMRASQIDYGCFFAELIGNARRFATSYNAALAAYRRDNRVKGTRHPIPDLRIVGDEVELPIWITNSRGVRHRLQVGQAEGRVRIYAGEQVLETYRRSDFESWNTAQSHIDDLTTAYQLRPRALTFTIWARLFLSDFFIHGIGGAKYDQIADMIIQDYFRAAPPQFCCVSATMWLGVPRYQVKRDDLLRARHQLRDTQHNPQRYTAHTEAARELIIQRRQLVHESLRLRCESPGDHAARMRTFQNIRSVNRRLAVFCEGQLYDYRERCSALDWQLKSNSLANSREYFYCLFSREQLAALQHRLSHEMDNN